MSSHRYENHSPTLGIPLGWLRGWRRPGRAQRELLGVGRGSISSLLSSLSLQVRTKDHRFESVSHLISYHMDNHLPIISAGSEMCLQQPVERRL